jgi:nucleotide-binding universal stress UspA family protein
MRRGRTAATLEADPRKEETMKAKPILLATDGSPSARRAVEEAVGLAKATGKPLVVVAVWQVPVTTYAYGAVPWVPELAEAEKERAVKALDEASRVAAAAGVAVDTVIAEGLSVQTICETAEERDAAMIVLGAHGWGTFKRLWFGSVSTGVLHEAHRPVLVVPSEPITEPAAVAAA